MPQDLELALRESTAKWKIVVGHHAIRSVGHHGDTQELINRLLPILQVTKGWGWRTGDDHGLSFLVPLPNSSDFILLSNFRQITFTFTWTGMIIVLSTLVTRRGKIKWIHANFYMQRSQNNILIWRRNLFAAPFSSWLAGQGQRLGEETLKEWTEET